MPNPLFVSLDGIDASGKSTQARLLVKWLQGQGHQVTLCRDPGGTVAGDRIRQILLDRATGHLSPLTETFLFMASRAQLVEEVIRPALGRGELVLCDRFVLSTVVYQGHAGNLDPALCWELGRIATGNTLPAYTFVFDMPVSAALQRNQGPTDRIEDKGLEYLERVRQGFLTEARRDPEHIIVIDAAQAIDAVQKTLQQEVSRVLARHSRS
jgi:dTMP kinase